MDDNTSMASSTTSDGETMVGSMEAGTSTATGAVAVTNDSTRVDESAMLTTARTATKALSRTRSCGRTMASTRATTGCRTETDDRAEAVGSTEVATVDVSAETTVVRRVTAARGMEDEQLPMLKKAPRYAGRGKPEDEQCMEVRDAGEQ
jgi:hypothetical protein